MSFDILVGKPNCKWFDFYSTPNTEIIFFNTNSWFSLDCRGTTDAEDDEYCDSSTLSARLFNNTSTSFKEYLGNK